MIERVARAGARDAEQQFERLAAVGAEEDVNLVVVAVVDISEVQIAELIPGQGGVAPADRQSVGGRANVATRPGEAPIRAEGTPLESSAIVRAVIVICAHKQPLRIGWVDSDGSFRLTAGFLTGVYNRADRGARRGPGPAGQCRNLG